MHKPRLLLAVPDDDLSLELFFTENCQELMDVQAAGYNEASDIDDGDWDFIYIRGPFVQEDFDNQTISDSIDKIIKNRRNARSVDGLHKFTDLLMEDKWRQYEIFKDIMPKTQTIASFERSDQTGRIIKKRISGRSRDIHFSISDLPAKADPNNYIVQERLDILTEYRAFMLGGELVLPLELKSSKTETSRNRVIGKEQTAQNGISEICRQVGERLQFDLMGLDIAETEQGLYLLEVNRSPQFVNYFSLSQTNLAEKLMAFLLEKKH